MQPIRLSNSLFIADRSRLSALKANDSLFDCRQIIGDGEILIAKVFPGRSSSDHGLHDKIDENVDEEFITREAYPGVDSVFFV